MSISEKTQWFAMRATYSRELEVKNKLDEKGIGSFIPMHYEIRMVGRHKKHQLVPVIHNLIFVHSTCSELQEVKSGISYLQYITDSRSGQKIIVPDEQMKDFIAVAGTYDEHLLFFKPEEINLAKGTPVRIIGGKFVGREGIVLSCYRLTQPDHQMSSQELKKVVQRRGQMGKAYPVCLRTAALRDYLSGMSRSEVARKYSLPDASVISQWKRKFAGTEVFKASSIMIKRRNTRLLQTDMESAQSNRIRELERALSQSQKALAAKDKQLAEANLHFRLSETMIDLAEEHFGVEIRKNFGSKP